MKTVGFAEAITDISRGNEKIQQSAFLPSGTVPIIDQGRSVVAGYTNDQRSIVHSEPPVIVFGDHTRTLKFIDFPFAVGADGVKLLKTRQDFDPKYVYHYLRSLRIPSLGYSRHFKVLKETMVPQPPLEEQRRIAAILDQADAIRAKRRQVLAYLDSLNQAIFRDMFSGTDWPTTKLGHAATTRLGKMLDAKKHTGNPTYPYLRNANVQWFNIDVDDLLEMEFNERERVELSLREGDVLICEGGQPGRAAIWDGGRQDVYFQKALHRVRVGDDLLPEYLVHFMWAAVHGGALKDFITSATIAHLTGEKLRAVPVPVPPLELQQQFRDRVTKVQSSGHCVERALAADDELFTSLQSRAFRGEL